MASTDDPMHLDAETSDALNPARWAAETEAIEKLTAAYPKMVRADQRNRRIDETLDRRLAGEFGAEGASILARLGASSSA